MKAGVDAGPEGVWVALTGEGQTRVRSHGSLEEALRELGRREVCLTVPLEALVIQNHTAERSLSPQEALTLGENLLGVEYVLPLPARKDAQGVYFFVGHNASGGKPAPGRSFVPRFLALLLALEVEEGILVYREGRRRLGVVFQRDHFPMIRELGQGSEVEEVERLVRYARSSGVQARVLVPEEEAETYAPLVERETEVEVYGEEGLAALGALRALETGRYLLQSQRAARLMEAETRYRRVGMALGGLGVILTLAALGANAYGELEKRNLEEAYTQAMALESRKESLRKQVEEERKRLQGWLELEASDQTEAILSLARRTTQEAWSVGSRLRGVEMRGGKEGVVLTLQGSKGNAVALLSALQVEGKLVLREYTKDGSIQVEVASEPKPAKASSR